MKRVKRTGGLLVCAALALVAAVVGPVVAVGQTYTWVGTADGNWSDSNNWDLNGVPASGAATVVQINAVDPLTFTSTNDLGVDPFVLNGLNLNSSSGQPVTVATNNTFQFAGTNPGINMMGTGAVTVAHTATGAFALPVFNVANPFTIGGAGTGTLTIGGDTDLSVFSGAGDVTVNFANVGAAANPNLVIGNMTGNPVAWTGRLNINSGYVRALRTGGDLFSNSTIVSVAAGSTFNFNNNAETFGGIEGAGTIVLGSAGMQFVAAGDRTWTGSISGTGGLDQSGGGVFTLGGTNTYTGNTLVAAGTIRAGNANALSAGSAVVVAAGAGTLDLNGFSQTIAGLSGSTFDPIALGVGTLTINGSGTGVRTFNGSLSGAGNLVIGGTATQNITGVNTYAGTTTINSGTLRANPVGLNNSSAVNVVGGTLDFNTPTNHTWTAPLTGAGNLVKSGAGTLTFANPVAITPASLAVNGGTLALDYSASNAAKFGGTPPLFLGSGALSVLGNGAAATSLTFDNTTLTGGGHLAVTSGNNQNATLNAGAITRNPGTTFNFRLANTGAGVATITTTNANGAANILGGWATVNGTGWAVTGAGAGPHNVTALAPGSYTGNTWSAGTHTDVTSSFAIPAAGATASVRFNAAAANTLTLTGTNNVSTGGVLVTPNVGANNSTIAAGTITQPANQDLIVQQHNTAGTLTIGSVIGNTNGTTVTQTAANLGTGRTVTLPSTAGIYPGMRVTAGTNIPAASNAHVVSVDSPTQVTLSFSAAPTAGAGVVMSFIPGTNVVKSGPGTLVLTANNTFNGALVINEGVVSATVAANLGTTSASGSSSVIFNGGTLRLTGAFSPGSSIQPYIFGPGGGTIDVANVGQRHAKQGNSISGSGTLTKVGAGELSIGSNASIFNGQVVVNEGILLFQSNQFQQAQGITVNPGGQYQINDDAVNGNFNIVAGGIMSLSGNGPVGSTTPGAFALTDQAPNGASPGGPATNFNSAVHLATDATVGVYNGNGGRVSELRFNNPVVGPGNLLKVGPGILALNNAFNSYGNGAGMTSISNGTVRIGGVNRLPVGTTLQLGQVGSTDDTTFDLNGFDQTVAGLTTVGSATGHQVVNASLAQTPATLTVNYNGAGGQTYAGLIGGAGGQNANINLVKTGTGTLSLTRENTYNGTTTVAGGTLRVFANGVNRPYAVSGGAGLTVVNQNPGGSFVMSTLSLGTTGASNLGFELEAGAPFGSLIGVADANGLTTAGTVNVSLASDTTLSVGQFTLVDYNGTIGGAGFAAFSGGTLTLPSRISGALVNNVANTSIDLNITGVDFVKWTGATNGDWNLAGVQNWKLNSNNAATGFLTGDTVVFDDSVTGTRTVNLTANVAPSTVTVNGGGAYTFQGAGKITGGTALTKNDGGTLTVLTNNDYTGGTTVNAGTLNVGNGGTTGAIGSGNLVNNGAVVFNRSDDLALAGGVSGTGSLTKSGAGTLSVAGAYTLGGNTTINAGALALTGGTSGGSFSGGGALVKNGVGTLVLTGNVGHTGGTTVNAGTLTIGDSGNNGTLAGNATVAAGATLGFNRSNDYTFAGAIGGAGGIAKDGSGRLTLSGPLTYTGPTAVNVGTLEYNTAAATMIAGPISGPNGSTIVKSGAGQLDLLSNNSFVGTFVIDQGTVNVQDFGGGGDLRANSIVINPGAELLFGGVNNPDLAEGNAGTFITINGGEFDYRTGEVWSALRLTNNGVFRFVGNNAGFNATVDATAGPFVGYELESGQVIAENVGTGNGVLIGNIAKTTAGTVTVVGRVAVTAASSIDVREGVLSFDTTNVPTTGTGAINLGSGATLGTLRVTGAGAAAINRTIDVNAPGAIEVADAAGVLTLTGSLNGGGTLAKKGPGTLQPNFLGGFGGTLTVEAGTVRVGPGSSGGTIAVTNGARLAVNAGAGNAAFDLPALTLANSVIDFELNTAGNPTAPLVIVNNTDALTLGSGTKTLNVSNAQPLGVGQFTLIDYNGAAITSGFTLGSLPARAAASLVYNAGNTSIDLNVTGIDSTLWNGTVNGDWDVGSAANVGGTNNFKLVSNGLPTNFITGDRATFDDSAAGTTTVNLTAAVQPASVTIDNTNKTYTFQGSGSIAGSTGLTKNGTGLAILATDNTYTGTTTVNAGTLQVGNGGTTGSIAGPVLLNSGAVLAFNRSNDSTYAGVITGIGEITKTGAGALTLSGNNNPFTGTLTINGGAVVLNDFGAGGDISAANIVINNGGSFVFGDAGNPDLPNSTFITINAGGVFDMKVGEVFGGLALKGGTFQMTGTQLGGINPTAQPLLGYQLESGTITTNFSGAANGGLLAGTTFTDKTTAGTVVIGPGVTFGDANTINIKEGVLEMGGGSFPATGATSVTIGDGSTSGTLRINDAVAGSSARPFAIASGGGTVDVTNAAGHVTIGGDLSGSGTLTKTGAGRMTVASAATFDGPAVVNGGTLAVTGSLANSTGVTVNANGAFEAGSSQTLKRATVNANGVVRIATGGPRKVLTVGDGSATYADPASSHLDLAGGRVDLTTHALVADYAAGNDAAAGNAIRNAILTGYAGGTWNGAGIGSSTAAATPSSHGVGYGLASDLLGPTGGSFFGTTVDGSAVLAAYTLLGDATLDGSVNFNDLVKLAQNYNTTGTGRWITGDFTYDGNVDFNDLVKLAQNYNQSLPTGEVPGAPAEFGADLAAAFASVPEPGVVGLLAWGALVIARRPRRRTGR